MLEKIAKLLNQAENAGTEAEAAVFMAKAQELASVHSIDLARARHATMDKQRTTPVQRTIVIGEKGTRGLRTVTDLYLGIANANDVRCTIAHDATRVYAVGFAEDIDVSEALFASLQVQQRKALDLFKADGAWIGEDYLDEKTWVRKPVTWLTARLNFQDAYASRVRHRLVMAKLSEEERQRRLDEERVSKPHLTDDGVLNDHFIAWFLDAHGLDLLETEATAIELSEELIAMRVSLLAGGVRGVIVSDDQDSWLADILGDYVDTLASAESAGTDLVLVSKRKAVDEAYAPMRRAARGSYRGGTSGASSTSGRHAGSIAGDRARLGSSTAVGGTKGAISA